MNHQGKRTLRKRAAGAIVAAAGGALALAAMLNPASALTPPAIPSVLDVRVTAEILEANVPASVQATTVTSGTDGTDGRLAHGVVVRWLDASPAVLGDERFTHHVTAEVGTGDLVIAGRGCGASWSELDASVIFPCTMDLRTIPVTTGESHEYPVQIYPELGSLRLQPGTYVVDQTITWWRSVSQDAPSQFTVRLTYEVTYQQAPLHVAIAATVLETGAPATVAVTQPITTAEQWSHGVRVTWKGEAGATLDDVRFTRHVTAEGGQGDLVLSGRGCGADYGDNGVVHICTADYRIVQIEPGETHEYPVRIYPNVGPLSLTPGTYIVDQEIGWQLSEDAGWETFTVRLTYTVTKTATQTGYLTPEPALSGMTIAFWSGGPASSLPPARAYWVTTPAGELISFVPDAPSFVNARFDALHPGFIPVGTGFLVMR